MLDATTPNIYDLRMPSPDSPKLPVANSQPLSPAVKAAWASGAIADVFMANAFSYLALPIYNIALKVDPAFLGWAMGIPRIWDALADSFMGNVSDNARTRWGRRRPFMLVGALLSGIFFALMWTPPSTASVSSIGYYFLAVSILYYTAYAVFTVPWGAMGLELSPDFHERTNVQAWKNAFQAGGGIFLGTMWWLALRLGKTEVEGVRWVGLIFGLLIAGAGVVSAVFGREQYSDPSREKLPFVRAFKETFSNTAFLCVVAFTLCIIFGVFVVNAFALYINIVYVFQGNKGSVAQLNMVTNAVFQIVGLAITPAIAAVARRAGKRWTLSGGLLLVALGFAISWWTYTPAMPYLQCITLGLISPGLACLWIVGPSMLADVCDLDELKTGLRREGMYSASFAWSIKAAIALTMVLSGYMLNWAGYDSAREAVQAPGVVDRLRWLYLVVPSLLSLLGIVFVAIYPLNEARVRAIREQLAERKSLRNAAPA